MNLLLLLFINESIIVAVFDMLLCRFHSLSGTGRSVIIMNYSYHTDFLNGVTPITPNKK